MPHRCGGETLTFDVKKVDKSRVSTAQKIINNGADISSTSLALHQSNLLERSASLPLHHGTVPWNCTLPVNYCCAFKSKKDILAF